ncbi:MAG: hypothetical protein WDM96_13700 [Lacunisphaera sp.]
MRFPLSAQTRPAQDGGGGADEARASIASLPIAHEMPCPGGREGARAGAVSQRERKQGLPGFASATGSAYLGAMPMFFPGSNRSSIYPRPVSPRSALADLKLMFAPDRPHRWGLLGVSAALTFVCMWGFWQEFQAPKVDPQIIYVESWMADRRDSDIIRQQIKDLSTYEDDLQKSQAQYQRLADAVGIEWRKEEEANKVRRAQMSAAMKKLLEKRLADALRREAAEGRTPVAQASMDTAGPKTP